MKTYLIVAIKTTEQGVGVVTCKRNARKKSIAVFEFLNDEQTKGSSIINVIDLGR